MINIPDPQNLLHKWSEMVTNITINLNIYIVIYRAVVQREK